MKNERKTEIRVGLTVIVGLIILLWILGWAKNFTIQSKEQNISVKFDNVAGLEISDNVTVNGVRKGFVKDMKVESNNVLVILSVDDDVDLRSDARFTLNMLDLMGGKRVEIYPGSSDEKLNSNEIYYGEFLSDIPSVMAVFGSVQDDLVTLLKDIKITLSSMNVYLTDKNMESDIKTSLSNFTDISKKLNLMIDENREGIKTLTSNTVELTDEAKKFIKTNKDAMGESVKKIKDVLDKTDDLLLKINKLTDETIEQENALGKLLYDEKMINDIKSALDQLNKLTKILVDQLQGDGIKVDANIF
ncbi:MAG: MlaD family protein [Ignavibacteriaceae bacterium]|nr:MlaD family protein [Ignavibacteriaceae bacterium]